MNSGALEPRRWSRRHWVYAVSGGFLLQAALVYFLAQPEQRPSERPIFRTSIQFAADDQVVRQISELPGLDDPTLLALPSLAGFSGAAWLKFPTLDYQTAEWAEPAHWLPLDTQSLATAFSQFIATNVIAPPLIADKPLPPLQRYEPNFPNEPLATQSVARIEGELSGRKLVTPVELKSWVASEILSNTIVQSAVDAAGLTFSATLLSTSGSTNADRHALAEVSNARFRPVRDAVRASDPTRSLTWGKWIFQWHTLPVPATNLAAITP